MKLFGPLTMTHLRRIVATLFVVHIFVGPAMAQMVFSDFRTITSVSSSAEGMVFVLGGTNMTPSSSCANTFVIANNAPSAELMRNTVTSAQGAGKKVGVSFFDNEKDCHILVLDVAPEK